MVFLSDQGKWNFPGSGEDAKNQDMIICTAVAIATGQLAMGLYHSLPIGAIAVAFIRIAPHNFIQCAAVRTGMPPRNYTRDLVFLDDRLYQSETWLAKSQHF
jgi:hypothetical protein